MRVFVYRRAGAVVVDGEKVLLIGMQPQGEQRWYHFPGGGIEDDESAEDAARRELFEETGLKAESLEPFLRASIHGGQHDYFLVSCAELELGDVTGPELDYAAGQDFRAEWIPISDLATIPVFPRCVAEHLADHGARSSELWVEDDRASWDGIAGFAPPPNLRITARAFITDGSKLAVIARERDGESYFTLPGGAIESGETAEDAVVREVSEELGVDIEPIARQAVVVYVNGEDRALQTYLSCRIVGGEFGTGQGEQFTALRQAIRGTYNPMWVDLDDLPSTLKPSWLLDRAPAWASDPRPDRPERFCESHDD